MQSVGQRDVDRVDLGVGRDALVLAGLLALARFAVAASSWEVANGFALMGASRDLTIAVFVEAALVLALAVAALVSGTTDLVQMIAGTAGSAAWSGPAMALGAVAFALVVVAEMFNSAIEATVDLVSPSYHPMAKFAKDIAAGAVLIAALNAVAVGYLVFSGEVATRSSRFLTRLSDAQAELTLVALAVTVILVIAVKAYTGRGTPLRGGLPSGHAAVAFAGWMAVTLILEDSARLFLISSVTFIMALLVAQTRVESGVHSSSEVASGAVLGALVTLLLFQVFG